MIVDCNYLQKLKLKEKVSIAYCMDESNISKMQSFTPAILVRVTKNKWELMDQHDDYLIGQMEWDGDDGVANMMGMYIKHADNTFCEYFRSLTVQPVVDNDDSNKVTPRRS